MSNSLYGYLSKDGFISSDHSRFKIGDFNINHLVSITHEIFQSSDNGYKVGKFLINLSEAFQKVRHKGLIFRLRQNLLADNLLNIFTTFFNYKKQIIFQNGQHS